MKLAIIIKELGISWRSFDFTPKRSKGGEIHLGWPPYFTNREQKTAGHFWGAGLSWNSSAQSKVFVWSELLCPASRLKTRNTVQFFVFFGTFQWRIFPNPQLWLLQSMKDHVEQNKDPRHKSHHKPKVAKCSTFGAYAASATLLQHSFTFSEGAIFKLNAISRERRCWSWKWCQFLLARKDWCYE